MSKRRDHVKLYKHIWNLCSHQSSIDQVKFYDRSQHHWDKDICMQKTHRKKKSWVHNSMGGRKGEDWTVDLFFMSVLCVRVPISCSTTSCLISCFSSSILSSGPFNSHPNSHLTHWCLTSLSSVTQAFLVAPFPSTSQQVSFHHMACSSHIYLGSFSDQPLSNTKFCICHYCLYLHWRCRSVWHLTLCQLHFFCLFDKGMHFQTCKHREVHVRFLPFEIYRDMTTAFRGPGFSTSSHPFSLPFVLVRAL